MDYQQMIDNMSPELYQNLKRSVEVGKWPDGSPLSAEQRQNALQAIIAWSEKHLPQSEQVGYIDKGRKAGAVCDEPQPLPLNWKD